MSGQDDEKFIERGWRTLENFFFPPVHVAMVYQLPSFVNMSSRTQRKAFLRTSAPQIDSHKAQEMSTMTVHLIFYLPDILHHIWHLTSVSLANTNMSHHQGDLLAWRIIASQCCSYINNVCKPCMETLPPQTFSLGTCSFQHTQPRTWGF